jgi:hypothetical protein
MPTSLARYGGLAALALTAIAFALNGSVPGNDSSGAAAAAWLDDNTARHILAAWCSVVGALALLGFLQVVRKQLEHTAGAEIARASSLLSLIIVVLVIAANAPIMAGAMTARERSVPLEAGAAETFLHFGIGFYLMMAVALGGYLAIVGTAMIRTTSLPSWLGYTSLAGSLLALLPFLGFLGVTVALPIWIVATTGWLIRNATPLSTTVQPA